MPHCSDRRVRLWFCDRRCREPLLLAQLKGHKGGVTALQCVSVEAGVAIVPTYTPAARAADMAASHSSIAQLVSSVADDEDATDQSTRCVCGGAQATHAAVCARAQHPLPRMHLFCLPLPTSCPPQLRDRTRVRQWCQRRYRSVSGAWARFLPHAPRLT